MRYNKVIFYFKISCFLIRVLHNKTTLIYLYFSTISTFVVKRLSKEGKWNDVFKRVSINLLNVVSANKKVNMFVKLCFKIEVINQQNASTCLKFNDVNKNVNTDGFSVFCAIGGCSFSSKQQTESLLLSERSGDLQHTTIDTKIH